mmetsp:Transcript_42151/g.132772  ORF Transcript_42151/g.132772 Transcript_42151/m.132772 type:complete len:284 (-) Transcript_42151:274-1125(-)
MDYVLLRRCCSLRNDPQENNLPNRVDSKGDQGAVEDSLTSPLHVSSEVVKNRRDDILTSERKNSDADPIRPHCIPVGMLQVFGSDHRKAKVDEGDEGDDETPAQPSVDRVDDARAGDRDGGKEEQEDGASDVLRNSLKAQPGGPKGEQARALARVRHDDGSEKEPEEEENRNSPSAPQQLRSYTEKSRAIIAVKLPLPGNPSCLEGDERADVREQPAAEQTSLRWEVAGCCCLCWEGEHPRSYRRPREEQGSPHHAPGAGLGASLHHDLLAIGLNSISALSQL